MQDMGFGLTCNMVEEVIMEYLNDKRRPNHFLQDRPGKDWWLRFMQIWVSLTERKTQHLQANCTTALTESTIVTDAGLSEMTQRKWNCYDAAFSSDVASKRILARRREKNVHKQTEWCFQKGIYNCS